MDSLQPSLRPPRGSRDAKEERQRLERECTEPNACLILTRRRLNALAPVSYLPPEVLRHIFSELQHRGWPDFDGSYKVLRALSGVNISGTELGWIVITHVCSQWRYLAIETPSLWCYISFPSRWDPRWIRTFLARSQSAPLSITYVQPLDWRGYSYFGEAYTRSIIHDHLFHVRNLYIAAEPRTLDRVLAGLSKPAHLLERVRLKLRPTMGLRGQIGQIPQKLFAGNAPCLRALSLTNFAVPWDSPSIRQVVRNLTVFSVRLPHDGILLPTGHQRDPFVRRELLPSFTQLLDILEASPSLKRLSLDGVLPERLSMDHHPSSHNARIVSLRHLDEYHLSGDTYDCIAVSRHIRANPRTHISLTCFTTNSGAGLAAELSAILSRLKDHISHCDHSPTFWSFINLFMDEILEIQTDPYTLKVSRFLDPSIHADFVQACLSLWPVRTPTHLRIRGSSGLHSAALIRALSTDALDCVDRVTLRSIRDLSVALCEQSKSHAAPLLPGLQEITLLGAHLPESTQLEIRDVLMLRKQAGRPIRRLKLEYCQGMSRSWAKQLESDFGVELSCDEETRQESY